MPPYITGSPTILDHTFPRDKYELKIVSETLGDIQNQIINKEIIFLTTEQLKDLYVNFEWFERGDEYALLIDIYRLLTQWLLQPNQGNVQINVSDIVQYSKHPLPENCDQRGNLDLWSDEMGKLLAKHDSINPSSYFIGVACEKAYTTGTPGKYAHQDGRAFPLVGPKNISILCDAFYWDTEQNIHNKHVKISDVINNYKMIGAKNLYRPSGGSHYTLAFPNSRTWVLDSNIDPVNEDYLSELETITGLPLAVIKQTLISGKKPKRRLKLIDSQLVD